MIPDANIEWKERAESVPLLTAAQKFGAKLRKTGAEWVGPCPFCNGQDRFAVNTTKNKWHCRGFGGGSSTVSMVMHIANLGFKESVEAITGEPCPSGPAKPLSPSEQSERENRRAANEAAQRQRKAQEAAYQEDTRNSAVSILAATVPMIGSGCTYLEQRGLKITNAVWFDSIRFHQGLVYKLDGKRTSYPCMVSRVHDLEGDTAAIQSIYLNHGTFKKAALDPCKVTMGPCGGGAVRLGGIAAHIYVCEGVETGIAISLLTNFKVPVWCTLGTSGLIGLEVPLAVSKITIWPDGDRPLRKQNDEFVPAIPAGRKAAAALKERQKSEGVECVIAFEPGPETDYADLYEALAPEMT